MEGAETTIISRWPIQRYKNYNNFFHPNVCHVCKNGVNLVECPSCAMISYCCIKHKQHHEPQHKLICEAIVKINKEISIWNNREMTHEEWINFKRRNIKSVEKAIARHLKPYEKKIFLFAKSCFVCHIQKDLTPCYSCMSVYTCSNHDLPAEHACLEQVKSLSLDSYYIYHVHKEQRIPTEYMLSNKEIVSDMTMFIYMCMGHIRKKLKQISYTDDFSGPLTLIDGMIQAQIFYRLQEIKIFVVHIIAEEHIAPHSVTAWEIVLHHMRLNTKLIIVTIGPELWDEGIVYYKTCRSCSGKLKELITKDHRMSYHDYACSSTFLVPNVIMAFDTELRKEEESMQIIAACQRQKCPLFLTAKSEIKANDNIIMIEELLGSHIKPIVNERNKFVSFRPYRDEETNSVFYRNEYLTIYRDLDIASDSVRT